MKEKFILFLSLILAFFLLFLNLPLFGLKTPSFSEGKPITLVAVGDVMLGRSVNAKMRSLGDFTYPFLKTSQFLKSADIALINLESPFYDPCPKTDEGMIFCADPKAVEGLVFAGVDIANLANNHIRNYGQKGVEETKKLLAQSKIMPLGPEDELVVKEIKGERLGFLGFDLTSAYNQEKIIEKVKKEAGKVDLLIVSFHWGTEYAQKPAAWQTELAHQVVEAGASLILGHHSHVVQEVENYKGATIVYSLGNFIFDQPWSEETKQGLVGFFTFQEGKTARAEFKKVSIQDFCQPEIESSSR